MESIFYSQTAEQGNSIQEITQPAESFERMASENSNSKSSTWKSFCEQIIWTSNIFHQAILEWTRNVKGLHM